MNMLFLMDPLETVVVHKDTTFAFMLAADRRGHRTHYVRNGAIHLRDGRLAFDTVPVKPHDDAGNPFDRGDPEELDIDDVGAIFIRNDPPFDETYLMNTWLLDHAPSTVPVINRPSGIRTVNEKIWAMRFSDLTPPTLLTRSKSRYEAFLAEHGRIIAKPANLYGGAGVFSVEQGDSNAGVIFEMLSRRESTEVILQRYIPEADVGDKRILLLDGEILGAVLRVHGSADHRNNFFAGGKAVKTEITDRDRQIAQRLQPHLLELGLHFVGIDVIGDCLIEVNVTSPTCLREIDQLEGVDLGGRVIARVEQLAAP